MNPVERRREALNTLQQRGRIEVSLMARSLGVSEMTIRRDLEALERDGLLRRVHGGAVPAVSRSYEPPYSLREKENAEAKARIGKACADLLVDGETVFIDVGSTALSVARALKGRINLTIITASLRAASLLADEDGLHVIVLGGTVRRGEQSLVGTMAQGNLAHFYPDVSVLGVGGISAEAGLTEFNLEDAAVKQAVVRRTRRIVVAADESKLGYLAFAAVAPLADVETVVTDASPDHESVKAIVSTGVTVLTV